MRDKNDTTIIVPTYNRPETCRRAVQSALRQTQPCRVMVANDGDPLPVDVYRGACYYPTGRADHWYLTVYDAVHRCSTPYVTVLCDDDWLEPRFLERCFELMGEHVAYVFAESTIRHKDGTAEPHWGDAFHEGLYAAHAMGELLLMERRIVTPSCCLYRREDVLRCLTPGGVPGFVNAMPWSANPSGQDHLMALLPLLLYRQVGYVAEPLVNLDAGDQSTTMQELNKSDRGKALHANYDNARLAYFALRSAKQQYRSGQ